MNRAEYINAVVHMAIEFEHMRPEIGAKILGAALSIMNRPEHKDEDLDEIWKVVTERYGWVMLHDDAPWN